MRHVQRCLRLADRIRAGSGSAASRAPMGRCDATVPTSSSSWPQHHWVASTEQLRAARRSTKSALRARPAHAGAVRLAGARASSSLPGVELVARGHGPLRRAAGRRAARRSSSGPTAGRARTALAVRCRRPIIEMTVEQRRRRCVLAGAAAGSSGPQLDRRGARRHGRATMGSAWRRRCAMLFGLAGQFNQYRFERAAEDVWHQGLVTPERGVGRTSRRSGRSGRGGVKRMARLAGATAALAIVRPERPRARPAGDHRARRPAEPGAPAPAATAVGRGRSTSTSRGRRSASPIEPGHSWWHGGDLGQRRDQARDRGLQRRRLAGHPLRRAGGPRDPTATAAELRAVHRGTFSGS